MWPFHKASSAIDNINWTNHSQNVLLLKPKKEKYEVKYGIRATAVGEYNSYGISTWRRQE